MAMITYDDWREVAYEKRRARRNHRAKLKTYGSNMLHRCLSRAPKWHPSLGRGAP